MTITIQSVLADNPTVMTGVVLFLIGLFGSIVRRHLITISACFLISFEGICLIFYRQSPVATTVFMVILAVHMLLMANYAIFAYRHRGTLNVDEFRELRG